MAVPYMGKTLKGWTRNTDIKKVTQTIVNHKTVEAEVAIVLKCNFQPMPAAKVNRKPEEQRTWIWWSIIVTEGELLKTDDVIIKDSIRYRIQSVNNWTESGFQKYEAIEDYV